jgi:hypothetical protein
MYNQWLPGDPGGGNDVFELSRIAAELWTFALGSINQSFSWTPGVGAQQQVTQYNNDFSRYLNQNSNNQAGFITTPIIIPGTVVPIGDNGPQLSYQATPPFYNQWLVSALDGEPGQAGAQPWLQRRTVVSQVTYQPPFFPQIIADVGAPPTTFTNYVTANYPTPAFVPTATLRFDVTGRAANVFRYAAGEGGQNPASLLIEAGNLLGGSLPPPDDQAVLGLTAGNGWSPY